MFTQQALLFGLLHLTTESNELRIDPVYKVVINTQSNSGSLLRKIATVGLQSVHPLLVMSAEMIILQKCGRTTYSTCRYHSVSCDNDAKVVKNLPSTMSDQKLSVCLADVASAINKQKKGNVQDLTVFTMRLI